MIESIKGKTFSVRFFLNKRVKPVKGKAGQLHYPVYVQVNFDGKNTQFPIYIEDVYGTFNFRDGFTDRKQRYSFFSEEYFNKILAIGTNSEEAKDIDRFNFPEYDYYSHLLKKIKDRIGEIIKFEISKKKYSFKGIRTRFSFFNQSLADIFDRHLFNKLSGFLEKGIVEKSGGVLEGASVLINSNMAFYQCYDAISFIYSNLPEDFRIEVESYFLLAAYSVHSPSTNQIFYWVIKDEKRDFENFLSGENLFKPGTSLRLPLSNFFVRYVSLNPPSKRPAFYINHIQSFANQSLRLIH